MRFRGIFFSKVFLYVADAVEIVSREVCNVVAKLLTCFLATILFLILTVLPDYEFFLNPFIFFVLILLRDP